MTIRDQRVRPHVRGDWMVTTGSGVGRTEVTVWANGGKFSEAALVEFATALLNAHRQLAHERKGRTRENKRHANGVKRGDPHEV